MQGIQQFAPGGAGAAYQIRPVRDFETRFPPTRRRSSTGRRGIISLLAMLFLVLFSVLALGFYAQVNMASQVSANERRGAAALVAAESGLQFVRYHLANLNIPAATKDSAVLEEASMQLAAALDGTANLRGGTVGHDATTITIPADPTGYVALGPNGGGFRATITTTTATADRFLVNVTGSDGHGTSTRARGIRTEFTRKNVPTTVWDYGVASRGAVQVKSSAETKVLGTPDPAGSILSTYAGSPSITTGAGPIEGDLSVAADKNQVSLGGGTVGGSSNAAVTKAQHIHVVTPPPFPLVDTTAFKAFATNTYVSGAAVQKNIRVPANTNPKFDGGDVINGILYIESPNAVIFSGNATVNGIIVFENKGTPAVNSMDFRGNVSPAAIPNTAEFDALRVAAKGWAIAAPTASVTMSGSVDGFLDGTLVAASVSLAGSADLTLTNGSIVALGGSPTLLQGKTVTFNGTGAANIPVTGVKFDFGFKPDPTTYVEVVVP
jgi:Tfp pilus assembly protein PilX